MFLTERQGCCTKLDNFMQQPCLRAKEKRNNRPTYQARAVITV
ncbi:hypothetical protein HMPREF1992_01812 [Selenomonas sp. oral taxon 892 str. F0426]|nr:hypothetical protein HMPREF1992_01812 [Selenomonas sp. oral taxon 892 str. F0426]